MKYANNFYQALKKKVSYSLVDRVFLRGDNPLNVLPFTHLGMSVFGFIYSVMGSSYKDPGPSIGEFLFIVCC